MTAATATAAAEVEVRDKTTTWCVIGAGSSGLAAAKNLRQAGLDVECFEREDELGGNWNFGKPNSRVYESTHMISSKPFTQYADFPMADELPDYVSHRQLLDYFRAYARHFELDEVIRYSTTVVRVEPVDGGRLWDVTVESAGGERDTGRYAGVIIANGHNWYPKQPDYPGLDTFSGEVMHSADYKGADVLRGRRVLVVGAGNTGCDVAVEAAQNAEAAFHSTRRGYWYAPKYIWGRPADQVGDALLGLRLPLRVRQALFALTLRTTVGDLTRHGLAEPDHKLFETHPIVNSQLVYYVGHGDLAPKPDIERFDSAGAVFTDGSRADVDLVVFCTGYLVRFEFIDREHLNWDGERPHLYENIFTPKHDNLFVAGLIQPDSGQFTLAHWQTRAIAAYLRAREERPQAAAEFRERVQRETDRVFSAGARYADSTRHYFEVAHMDYLRALERDINRLEGNKR